ncbi:hypothetical protein PGT21_030180 [Puccinia graminis f. sp. tritici]|uniref:Uncharacterized protein n=2 Tax=Puccinia graminis f. sp. tritici TaxID=56615 RepID=A0A5B0QCA3_PUCGR|nr:hypothetical protein PGT21_030180 [Puccinia graminis f. sp. tritici]
MAICLAYQRKRMLFLCYLQVILYMTAMASGILMRWRGATSAPAIPSERGAITKEQVAIKEEETIQEYNKALPSLKKRQLRLQTKPAELKRLTDRLEWQKTKGTPQEDFKHLIKDLANLTHDTPNDLNLQQNSQRFAEKIRQLQDIFILVSPKVQSRLSDYPAKGILPTRWLSDLLQETSLSTGSKSSPKFDQLDKRHLKLQRIILQTIHYLLEKQIISGEQFRDFYREKNNIELAAMNMIATFRLEYAGQPFYPKYPRTQLILSDNYSSHLWSLFTGEGYSLST